MNLSSVEAKKTTSPSCVAVAVAILGDKWTPHVIRVLAEGNMRFCPLQDAVGGVNPRTLSARLSYLEAENIIAKQAFSDVSPHAEYALTQKGKDLLPILHSMAAWGEKYRPQT